MSQTEKRIAGLNHEERASLNMLVLHGMNNVARCIEWLMMNGETVLLVMIGGQTPRIEIVPPSHASKLWREADTCRSTEAEVSFFASRFGCEIRWTMTHAEAEQRRPQRGATGVH
jgi:hypothetical protein